MSTYDVFVFSFLSDFWDSANYDVAVDGNFTLEYGTSISTSVVAAMLAMINDARITKHKKPIGFINPTVRPIHS
jgi:tripeptidyl-peptidase I